MKKTTADLERLDLPAEEGVRLIALAKLREVELAAARLRNGEDGEALHDFRVGLRRLRTVIRAFRPWLKQGPKRKHERALKTLAGSTNEARDAEVQLAWLSEQKERLTGDRSRGLEWLMARYESRKLSGAHLEIGLEEWQKLLTNLRQKLSVYERHVRPLSVAPISEILARTLRVELAAFREALAAVAGADDVERAHRARIRAKRLRYLLEPLRSRDRPGAEDAIRGLKDLQDLLGELHDAHVFLCDVVAFRVAGAGASRPPALSPITRLARSRRDKLFARLVALRLGGTVVELAAKVDVLATALEASGSPLASRAAGLHEKGARSGPLSTRATGPDSTPPRGPPRSRSARTV